MVSRQIIEEFKIETIDDEEMKQFMINVEPYLRKSTNTILASFDGKNLKASLNGSIHLNGHLVYLYTIGYNTS